MLPRMIAKLTDAEERELAVFTQSWLNGTRGNAPIDRERVARSVAALYAVCQLPTPGVIFLKSLWQMLAAPLLVNCVLRTEEYSDETSDSELWMTLQSDLLPQMVGIDKGLLEYSHQKQLRMDLFNALIERADKFELDEKFASEASQFGLSVTPHMLGQWSILDDELHNRRSAELGELLSSRLKLHMSSELFPSITIIQDKPLLLTLTADDVADFVRETKRKQPESALPKINGPLTEQLVFNVLTKTIWCPLWSTHRLPYYGFLSRIAPDLYDDKQIEELSIWLELARGAFCYAFYEGICFVCQRPERMSFDQRARLHDGDRAALLFADSYRQYWFHNVAVPTKIIESPESITVRDIETEPNVEVRRIMIRRYGRERYVRDSAAEILWNDSFGTLLRIRFRDDEPLVMLRVMNRTAEPDGTFKEYYLRVPPNVRTSREAVAWSFNMDPTLYQPDVES